MSVLTSNILLKLLSTRELVISPILSDHQIQEVSIDLRLGNVALVARARGLPHVDPTEYQSTQITDAHRHEQGKRQKLERHEILFRQPLLLHPNILTLVPTLEWLKLPMNLMGVVTARSSWAREGLNITTANFINPGYNGIITLELCNLGQIPITIYPGMRIAQIAFYTINAEEKENELIYKKSQFDMSFEPRAGDITQHDNAFIPKFPKQNERRRQTSNK